MEDVAKDVTNQLCKLRLTIKDRSVDMALPADVPLVELLPAILRHADANLADEGVEHDGWVLQRLGESPLDENRTPVELGLLDGETVHLRPRSASVPEIDFDDLVDGVAEQNRNRTDPWNEQLSRWMLLSFATVALLLGEVMLGLAGPIWPRVAASGITAAVLLLAAAGVARGKRAVVSGTVLAFSGTVYSGLFGWLLPAAFDTGAAAQWACAGAFVLAALAVGLAGVGDAALLFVSALFGAVPLTVTAVLGASTPLDSSQVAGIGAALTLIVLGIVPTSAFRLGGLTLPPLPTSAEEFGEDLEPIPHRVVVERSALADRYMTALHAALGLTSAVLLTLLVSASTLWAMITGAVAALLLLLRSRNLTGSRQRWALLAPGAYVGGLDLILVATLLPGALRPVLFGGAVVLAVVLLVCSTSLPGRKLRPYWGRAVDILESLCAVAVIPLLLAVLDVYEIVLGMTGY